MKTSLKLGWILGILLLVGAIAFFWNPFKKDVPAKNIGSVMRGNPPKLPITKQWSATLIITPPYSIYADVEEEDIAVIHRYNGGPANGGWDDPVPARKNRGPDWVPKFFDKMVMSVCYAVDQNETKEKATIVYSIVR